MKNENLSNGCCQRIFKWRVERGNLHAAATRLYTVWKEGVSMQTEKVDLWTEMITTLLE